MFPPSRSVGVKICGITSAAQAESIVEAGADALGLNFWEKSKRYVPPATAAGWDLIHRLPTTLVAVLVNPSLEQLAEIVDLKVVHMLQLHGDESPDVCARVIDLGLPVIKALQVRDQDSLATIGDYPCTTILLDAYCPGAYGGEGKTFPWALAIEAMASFPTKQFILAGGLTPDNIAEAVGKVHPAAVDVASGVESSPGVKDLVLVQRFISQARSAAA